MMLRSLPSLLAAFLLNCALLLAQAEFDYDRAAQNLIDASPAVARGRVAYKFVDIESGQVLAEQNNDKLFTPASNAKLYTTALALARLGPDYRFRTELRTRAAWQPGQTTLPELELVGGGDPNLSGRSLPYVVGAVDGDPLAPLEDLATQLENRGITEITGDVIGVSTRYPGDRYPDGWTLDDSTYGYGAPVSALALNDNLVTATLRPGVVGDLAAIELRPWIPHLVVLNHVVTVDSGSWHIDVVHPAGSNEVVLRGTIGANATAWQQDLGVNDPELFAAEALIQVLRNHGITVRGAPRCEAAELIDVEAAPGQLNEQSQGAVLAVHESVNLAEIIKVINKVSQNLHAEMLLREVAAVRRGQGTLAEGLKEREDFLTEAGVTEATTGFVLVDGSGLARQDLTTPDSTVAILRYMWARPEREVWLGSLPVGALDGSLEHRLRNIPGAAGVHAKTGSISHVNTLSGYMERESDHRWLAFSIMVNATDGPEADVREFIDQLCAIFLSH
jgi:serine-type D-Ala-D-Ala carboxypeptidase/endopeptidase (penicillin-binding protein 4)